MKKVMTATIIGCSVLALSVPGAEAVIVATGGDAVKIAPPPSLFSLESDTTIFAFDEQQQVTLTTSVAVDISAPGTYDDSGDLTPATIPAGTCVSSHFLHADRATEQGPPTLFNGTVVVDADILGIAILGTSLNATDVLGAPGTGYPKVAQRQMNLDEGDQVIEMADLRTVEVQMAIIAHADQVRIITECPPERLTPTIATEVHDPAHNDVTGQTVPAGTVVHDQAIVTGPGPVPTGTVDFLRFDNGTCSGAPATIESDVPLLPDGTAESSSFTTVAGAISYLVHYDGDAVYTPADGPCEPLTIEAVGAEGCTPGFWKQRQHFDSWVGFAPTDSFEAVFGRDAFAGDPTLLDVLEKGGGGLDALGRHAVAALLNATSPDVDFAFTSSEVIALFQAAFDSGSKTTIESTKDQFDAANNAGCPLS